MFARPMTQRLRILAIATVLPLAVACSNKDSTGPDANALVGTWQVTSFQAFGVDVIQLGMTMKFTFTATDTYSLVITGDAFGGCETSSDCTENGTYAATTTRITMDAGTPDEVTFNYSIQGARLTFTGDVEGTPVTIVLQRS